MISSHLKNGSSYFFIGGGLAVCGAVFQTLLRNPLAEPFTLGVSGGGAFGVSVALLAGMEPDQATNLSGS